MMTVTEALDIRQYRMLASSMAEMREAELVLLEFASDMVRMLDGLARVSFPIPEHLRITLDPDDDTDAVYVTTSTADRIYRALGEALKGRS